MENWKTVVDKIKELQKSKNLSAAKEELSIGLDKFPNQFNLLNIATDVYRASGDRQKSLEYAELLITHFPDKPPGYIRSAQDLIALKRFEKAREKIQIGLEKFPSHVNLLTIASKVYRASGDREKSLECAELLITHLPDKPAGYICSAQDLIALKRFEQAQEKIQIGLKSFLIMSNSLLSHAMSTVNLEIVKISEYAKSMYGNNVTIPTKIFGELLIYSFKKSIQKDANQRKLQVSAADWFYNRKYILSSEQMPFNVFYIPKNACSSIKYSLLNKFTDATKNEIERRLHRLARQKLSSDLNFEKEFICLVRNPFSRFISGFTNKCRPGGDPNVWLPMCQRYGLDYTSFVSMDTLLDALLSDEPNLIDGHFRPQHKINCSSAITPSRIFYMEQINELASFLQTYDCEFIRHSPHSSEGKAKTIDELDSKTIDKIYRLYKEDFALYGYSENPRIKDSSASVMQNPQISNLLTSKDAGSQLCRDSKVRDSLLFEDPFLEKKASLKILVNNAII